MKRATKVTTPRELRLINTWYIKSCIDYAQQYMLLYTAFNGWYRVATRMSSDRESIRQLKVLLARQSTIRRMEDSYRLKVYMVQIVEATQRDPLLLGLYGWSGVVNHSTDWKSLVEFWYRVRCLLVHGSDVSAQNIYLAFESLTVFMEDIVGVHALSRVC